MPLTAEKQAERARLQQRNRVIRQELIYLGGLGPEELERDAGLRFRVSRMEALREEFDRNAERIGALDFEDGVDARGQVRDEAFADVARQQAEAAKRIAEAARRERRRLQGYIDFRNEAQLLAQLQTTYRNFAAARNKTVREAMLRVAKVADLLNQELAVRTFGRSVFAGTGGGVVLLGGGAGPEVVDRIWNGIPDVRGSGLRWLLDVQDREDLGGLTTKLRELVAQGRDSRRQWQRLKAEGFPDAGLSKWVSDLGARAREAARGVPGALEEYRNLQRQARAYIAQRKAGPLGTKGAGTRLLQRLEKGLDQADEAAINRALEQWIERKSAYKSVLAMRSATNRTYDEEARAAWLEEPWVYAERRVLAANHPKVDVCNAVASFNLGLGPGVYPIGKAPEEHPQGLCRSEPVIDRDFLKRGGVPLGWRAPDDIDQVVKDLSFNGQFARAANGAKDLGTLDARMAKAGFGARPAITLTRTRAVGPNNLLTGEGAPEGVAAQVTGASKWKPRREMKLAEALAFAQEDALDTFKGALGETAWSRLTRDVAEELGFDPKNLEGLTAAQRRQLAGETLMQAIDEVGTNRELIDLLRTRAGYTTESKTMREAFARMGWAGYRETPGGIAAGLARKVDSAADVFGRALGADIDQALRDVADIIPAERWAAYQQRGLAALQGEGKYNPFRASGTKYTVELYQPPPPFGGDRSYASSSGHISLRFAAGAARARKTTFHEVAHTLEFEDRDADRFITEFFKSRTKGQKPSKLKDLVKGSGYEDREEAIPDKFANPYTGKVYPKRKGRQDTEVLSMGFERFSSQQGMQGLIEDDFEHFLLTWASLYAP